MTFPQKNTKESNSYNLKKFICEIFKFLDEADFFLRNMYASQIHYTNELRIKKSFRDTLAPYLNYTDYIIRGEKLLEFLAKLLRKLSFELTTVNSQIGYFETAEQNLKEKWNIYKELCSILQKSPNENFRYIRFKMYNYNPNWENYLENSTKIILHKMEVRTISTVVLTENVESILKDIINKKGEFATYNLPYLKKAKDRAQKLKFILSAQISEVNKRFSILKNLLDNSIVY